MSEAVLCIGDIELMCDHSTSFKIGWKGYVSRDGRMHILGLLKPAGAQTVAVCFKPGAAAE